MTTTSLIEFKDGVAAGEYEFGNSWGGADRAWDSLFKKYIPKKFEYDNWLLAAEDKRLWTLGKDPRLSDAERAVYYFFCDNALVKKKDFPKMAKALREFIENHPVDGKVDHLEAFAKVFDQRNMGGRCKESIVRVVLSRLLNSPSSQSGHNRTKADT